MKALVDINVDVFDQIADDLIERGYCILSEFIQPEITAALYRRVMNLDDEDFQQAGIGRDLDFQIENKIRSDETRWLNEQHPVDGLYLNEMAEFRLEINRRLFLGLFDYESHYAHYAPGAFYHKHLDAFKGESNRVLTTVMYFNHDWQPEDGGELLIYHPETDEIIEKVQPQYGTFVIFLSEQFPHEVVKSERDRYSIAGWFRLQDPLQAPSI